MSDVGNRLLSLWSRVQGLPGGQTLFAVLLGRMVPYSGSTRPRVLQLEPGLAVVQIADRRRVRNHLKSVHAIALANVGELASGLAMTAMLGPDHRAIVTHLEIDYTKKARGTLTATGRGALPSDMSEPSDTVVTSEIVDSAGDVVATVRVTWRVGPKRPPA